MENNHNNIEKFLRRDPSILDCRLISRSDLTGVERTILYFAPTGQYSTNELKEQLAQAFPEMVAPDFWAPVSRLPLQADGDPDVAALAVLPLFDEALLNKAESVALSQNGVRGAVSLVGATTDRTTPLYLDDLLPTQTRALDADTSPDEDSSRVASTVTTKPALSDEGELLIPDDAPATLPDSLKRASECALPAGLMTVHQGQEATCSYAELLKRAEHVLGGLRAEELEPGTPVVLQFRDNQDFLTAFWGCVLGGFVPVPLAPAQRYDETNAAVQTLINALQMFGNAAILTSTDMVVEVQAVAGLSGGAGSRILDLGALANDEADTNWHVADPDDVTLIMLTSGSTGAPKGVPLTHRNLIYRSIASIQVNGFNADTISLNWMPLDHVAGIIYFHLRDIYLGCRQVHAATDDILQNPLLWLDLIERYSATVTFAPNFAFGLLCGLSEEIATHRQWDLSSMKLVLNGGEAVVAATARQFLRLLEPHGLSCHAMCPAWGMSETTSGITYARDFELDNTSDSDTHVAVGPPLPGNRMRIVDEHDQLIHEGEEGRLQVTGLNIFNGYYNNDELNKESFTADGWFKTGDLGRLNKGSLTITGREKDVIIINGVNYSGPGIEQVVEEIKGVARSYVAACAVNDLRQGGRESLAVFFVPEVSGDPDLQALLKEIRGQVVSKIGVSPDYLVPLTAEAIPKTSIGKIQRKKLKQKFEAEGFAAEIKQADLLGGTHCIPPWFFRRIWKRSNPLAGVALEPDETVLLFGGTAEINQGLEEKIRDAGAKALHIVAGHTADFTGSDEWQIRPQSASDYQQLIRELQAQGRAVRNVVCMWPCTSNGPANSLQNGSGEAAQTALAVIACCQALAGDTDNPILRRIMVVTDRGQSVGGERNLDCLHAPVAGLVKTLRQETPQVDFLHLDIDSDDDAASVTALTTELANTWNSKEVAWRAGKRWVSMLETAIIKPVVNDALNLDEPACFVITGGLGGIGLKLTSHLLRMQKARVLLMGRSALDTEAMTAKSEHLNQLARMPGEIEYINIDVADARSLEMAIENQLAKWDVPLAGIFHLAGSYHEGPLADETVTTLQRIFHAKIGGAVALAGILKQHPNAFLANFSSVASVFGGAMVGAYAAANQFLDTFTAQLVDEGYRSFSFNWSAWRQTGMNQGHAAGAALKARGILDLPVDQALTGLRIALGQPQPGQMVIGLDANNEIIQRQLSTTRALGAVHSFFEAEDKMVPSQLEIEDAFGTEVTVTLHGVEEIPHNENGDFDIPALQLMARQGNSQTIAPRTATEQKLSEIWQRVLRLDSISTDWNFFEVGGQSIVATSLIAAVRAGFSVDWTLSDIFSAPTIATQAAIIDKTVGSGEAKELSIPVASRGRALPLSSAQQRLWFLGQVEPESAAYNITASVRFQSTPDPLFVEECLNSILARHESLRTVFPHINGVPEQKILDRLRLKINIASPQSGQSMDDFRVQEGRRPFNLSEGPLIHATLVSGNQGGAVLLLTLHHIIADGWSMRVFFNEFSRLFSGESPESLSVLDVQYADYTLWQQSRIEEGVYAAQVNYWAKQLKGILSGFTLPTDFPRPKVQTYNGARVTQRIPAALFAGARELAANRGVTPFVLMLTAFKALLARYAQCEDIVVGTVVANRDYAQIENLIGFFVNPLVLRSSVIPTLNFSDLLTQVRQVTLDAYAHHDLPFERLVEQLQPVRDTSRSPLFQIAFDLRDPDMVRCDVDGLGFGIMEPDLGSAQYDLHLTLEEDGADLTAFWEFNTDLYSRATIERMSENYQQLLASVLAQPDQPVSQLSLLSDSESALLQSWNECSAPFPDQLCMHQLFEQHALSQPDADALIFTGQRMSYADLNRRANQLAHYLREQGAGPDKIIGICLDRSVEMLISVLAILKSGSAYLALDPTYPSDRLAFILEDSDVSLLLSNALLAARLPSHNAKVIQIDKDTAKLSLQPDSNPDVTVDPTHLAYVIYTSGSTGKPKGVLVEHHGWCNVAQAQIETFGLVSGMRVLQFASMSFDASAFEFSMAWGSGGALCLGTQDELLPGPNLVKMLSNNAVEVVTFPPSALGAVPDAELPDLKVITVAGEACPQELVQRWSKPGRRFFNLYGPTETTIWASYEECFSNLSSPPPIGKPVANMQFYTVDQQLQRLPVGMPGELCIGGEGITRGYLNRPELNAERFALNPFSQAPGARLYRSGDLVRYLPDGSLEFLGRMDHQVKIRGHRIELGEIESQLRQFPGVTEAVVVAHKADDGDQQLLAYVSPADKVELSRNALREHLRRALPTFMLPTQIRVLDKMPLSHNGKVDRKALLSLEKLELKTVESIRSPQSEMEQKVGVVWKQILKIEAIDIHQNFFDLGGHSMKMAQVQTALSQMLGREVPIVDLFQYPTISTLAAHLGNGLTQQAETNISPHQPREGKPGSQNRMAQLAALNKAARKRR